MLPPDIEVRFAVGERRLMEFRSPKKRFSASTDSSVSFDSKILNRDMRASSPFAVAQVRAGGRADVAGLPSGEIVDCHHCIVEIVDSEYPETMQWFSCHARLRAIADPKSGEGFSCRRPRPERQPQSLRRGLAEGSSVLLGKAAEVIEAVPGCDLGDRHGAWVRSRQLGMNTRKASLFEQRHRGGVAEGPERQLQCADATSGGGGDLGQPDRLCRMGMDKRLGTSNLLRRGGAPLARYRVSIIVWLPMQQDVDDEFFQASGDRWMAQRRVGFDKLLDDHIH